MLVLSAKRNGIRVNRLTSLSTFTGLGGMDLGLEAAGFDVAASVEWDEGARRSIKANRGDRWNLLPQGDIAVVADVLAPADLGMSAGDLDLLAGAPPCQPYSKAAQWVAGARRGLRDQRGQYLDDYLTLLMRFEPKVGLIENVRGFVQGRTSAIEHIERFLAATPRNGPRYRLLHRVVDAADCGVPQVRSRAILVLTRIDREFDWPEPLPRRTAWDAIGSDDFDEPEPAMRGRWADVLASIPEGDNYLWHTSRGGGAELFGYRTRYWSFLLKLAKNRPSWTLPAQPGPATGPFHWNSRPLRIQEMLRLQSFPATWAVEGETRSDRVRLVGNATPPLLAEAIGRALRAHITGQPFREEPLELRIPFAGMPPDPTPPLPLPDRFQSMVGERAAHPGPGKGPGARRSI